MCIHVYIYRYNYIHSMYLNIYIYTYQTTFFLFLFFTAVSLTGARPQCGVLQSDLLASRYEEVERCQQQLQEKQSL